MGDFSKYAHSPAHLAVLKQDHDALKRIVAGLPRLAKAGEVNNEEESVEAEKNADQLSAVIDTREVPGRETPLHLAVRLKDAASAEILMGAGADWSLQNENGWSALQEAVCTREETIALIIARHYQPLAWAKWCRRLPRIVATAARIRDFYMEISFHFESSVIPFIGRIAPSDTYRIWKRGANLRADMTMGGFDGFRIQRSDQTFLFLGEGYTSEDGSRSLPPGSLLVLGHKNKEVTNTLEGAGAQPSEAEVAHEVATMSQTNMYRPGIDVTQSELIPRMNWRRQVSTEMVGPWKAKVYDMNNVMVSMKSRRVPGAMTDEEMVSANEDGRTGNDDQQDDFDDVLTAEERMQLDSAIRISNGEDEGSEGSQAQSSHENHVGASSESYESNAITKEKKGWLGWSKRSAKHTGGNKRSINGTQRTSSELPKVNMGDPKKNKDKSNKKKKAKGAAIEPKIENEYKKGVKPVLWLTPDFPLKIEELLPLLDILANKVKAVRRLRELLTTKLPPRTFPVKIAIPIVPTIRVLVTFSKFEELQPIDEFSTPPSSPQSSPTHFQDAKSKESEGSTSWISWMRGGRGAPLSDGGGPGFRHEIDPFHIPSDYTWIDANEKKRRLKAKQAANRKQKKPGAPRNPESGHRASENTTELP